MGEFTKSLLSNNLSYHGTQLPRIPVPVQRQISKEVRPRNPRPPR